MTAEKAKVADLESNAGWVSAPVKILADCVQVTTCASGSGESAVEEVLVAEPVADDVKAANAEITRLNALVGTCSSVTVEKDADAEWESAAYIEDAVDGASL